jgi:starch synthase
MGIHCIDLLQYICDQFMSRDAQLAIIGTGEAQYEHGLTALSKKYPGKMVVRLAFDPALADRVYAGADAYLMPSKSEPFVCVSYMVQEQVSYVN